ncbi:Thermophilic serine proteinase [bacterium HR23]|nr:Thermophilic serine proteinase [bacterium HR23]
MRRPDMRLMWLVALPIALLAMAGLSLAWVPASDGTDLQVIRVIAGDKNPAAEGEALVKFKGEISTAQAQDLLKSNGIQVLEHYASLGIWRVRLPQGMSVKEASQRLGARIAYIEPNYLLGTQPTAQVNLVPVGDTPSSALAPTGPGSTPPQPPAQQSGGDLQVIKVIQGQKPEAAPGEALVRFKGEVAAQAESILQAQGLKVLERYNLFGIYRVALPQGVSAAQVAKNLAGQALYVEPNYIVRVATTTPNDPSFGQLWGLHNTGQDGGTPDADIDAPEAWDIQQGATSTVVAVVDTGIDFNHPDLSANMWRNPGETPGNNTDDDGNGYVDDVYGVNCIGTAPNNTPPLDDNNHGTHVAGTIGAVGNNATGTVGVMWRVGLMALKFLDATGTGTTADAIECIQYAVAQRASGTPVRVLNNSWGGGGFSNALRDAIIAARNQGMLFIAAAGNANNDNDASPHYPCNYDVDNIICVAASDRNDNKASFSNFGNLSVDLAAPGVSIFSTVRNGGYSSMSGTSMATPHVSGVAGLLFTQFPGLTYQQAKRRILCSVDLKPQWSGLTLTEGRLNAFNALTVGTSSLFSMALAPDRGFRVLASSTVVIRAELCAGQDPVLGATVTASFANGDPPVTLRDDGVAPDTAANDGIYAGNWVPQNPGQADITITATKSGLTPAPPRLIPGRVRGNPNYQHAGVPFEWEDIRGVGLRFEPDDDWCVLLGTSMPIQFFGEAYTQFTVSSNGFVSFPPSGACSNFANEAIPNSTLGEAIAVFWDDLVGRPDASTGEVWVAVLPPGPGKPWRRLVVQWQDMQHFGGAPSGASFQVAIEEVTGRIFFRYLDTDFGDPALNNGASATAGIQLNATMGLPHSHNQPVLTSGSAFVIFPAQPSGLGKLRVETQPPSQVQIYANGILMGEWGLDWPDVPAGIYRLEFRNPPYSWNASNTILVRMHPPGGAFTEQPVDQPIVIESGKVTEVILRLWQNGFLRVTTEGAFGPTILVNGTPRNAWQFWATVPPGTYTVSFAPVPNATTPCTRVATVVSGSGTRVHGNYTTGSCDIVPYP